MMGYRHVLRVGRRASVAIVLLAGSIFSAAQNSSQQPATPQPATAQTAAEPAPEPLPTGSASRGRELFVGTRRFANRGSACASCHQVAGISFPNGGTLGPNLSGIYGRFGPDALQVMLQTLFFPTMAPLFADRLLTPQEQSDLLAFFQQTSNQPPSTFLTAKIAMPAAAGFLILLAVSGRIWRNRLRKVRKGLVQQCERTGDAGS